MPHRKDLVAKKDFQTANTGERTNPTGKPVGNRILLSVSDKVYRAIRPHLEFLSLPHQLSLYEPNDPLEFVYFPNDGMVSLVIETEDERTVKVGEVEKEGFAGIPAVVGMRKSQVREVVQIAGDGFRMRVDTLQKLFVVKSTTSTDADSVCSNSLYGIGSDCRVQSTSQYRTALRTLATDHSGQSGFPDVRHHPGFPCHDAGDGPAHGKLGSRNVAEKGGYQVGPW